MDSHQRPLTDQVAIVTGGGGGIGRATALALSREGATVIIAERRNRTGRTTERLVREAGGTAQFIATDVTDWSRVRQVVRQTMHSLGRVDILINNAGILRVGEVANTSIAVWRKVLDVNLTGAFLCCRAVLPVLLRRRSGCIINIASQMGKESLPELAAYCASKFGLVGFTGALAEEVAEKGVRVYAVCPGPVDTPMLHKCFDTTGWDDVLEPEEVARIVVDLARGRRCVPCGAVIDLPRHSNG